MRNIISVLSVVFVLLIFTFFIDGEIGMIIITFLIFAPLVSFIFALSGRKRVNVSFSCESYVKKNGKLRVTVNVEKSGFFPVAILELRFAASEVFGKLEKSYKISMAASEKKEFTFDVDANVGGNGEISLVSAYSSGFLGFVRFKLKSQLPQPVSVGVIPEIPEIKTTSQLFRNIADSVITSDEEENNDTALRFSASTAPGYEHREYENGDPLKRVNWKLSVKKGTLMVRLDEAIASVQPVIVLDLFRKNTSNPLPSVVDEEKLICSVFGLISMLIRNGIASTLVYYGADGEMNSESVENPEQPQQLLLKILASKVVPERRIKPDVFSACALVAATTDAGAEISDVLSGTADKESISLIGISADSKNHTEFPMWYLDGDSNFKLV